MIHHNISIADKEFQKKFEKCEIPKGSLNHYAHIRLAYIYLCRYPPKKALSLFKNFLLSYLQKNNIDTSKYSETITISWMMAVNCFMTKEEACCSAESFINRNPQLLDDKIMLTHYSPELLFSNNARKKFIHPDIQKIPCSHGFL